MTDKLPEVFCISTDFLTAILSRVDSTVYDRLIEITELRDALAAEQARSARLADALKSIQQWAQSASSPRDFPYILQTIIGIVDVAMEAKP